MTRCVVDVIQDQIDLQENLLKLACDRRDSAADEIDRICVVLDDLRQNRAEALTKRDQP